MPTIARRIALSVLDSFSDSSVPPDDQLNRAFEEEPELIQPDRALATTLVFGVLRWRSRLDWVIQHLSETPIHKVQPRVQNILRLGLYQILFLSRIPVSAAVNESVELAKGKAPLWVINFINGVLRSAARRAKEIPLPDEGDNPVTAIAVRESHPHWMVKRWVDRLGAEETKRLCMSNNQIPPVTVRVNALKISRERLLNSLSAYVREIERTVFSPDGLTLTGLKQPVGQMPPFQEGWFQVQDEAAQLITYLLNPQPGETILDACAGYGGKTAHIAHVMGDSGFITALDQHAWKLRSLQASMARLGVSTVSIWQQNLEEPLPESHAFSFDRILLDAPCSGLGVIRRNPDIKWKKEEEDLTRLQRKQQHLLASLAPLVKKGGCLVYCVCSLEPEEGEEVVEAFLKSHGSFIVDGSPSGLPQVDEQFIDALGIFKTLSYRGHMDGFFAVRLKKVA